MKRYIAVLELEADEKAIEADVRYNYSIDGEDYSVLDCVWFNEENKEEKMKTYEDGINEAWEAARKVLCDCGSNLVKLEDIFNSHTIDGIFSTYNGKEAIEKIKEYEETQKKAIFKIGDEVVDKNEWGIRGVVTETTERYISIVKDNGKVSEWKKKEFEKTGRHFSQIEEVLERMKENE